MKAGASEFYEFGPFRVDPHKRLLLRDGSPLPVGPRAVDILTALIERRDRVVSKDELLTVVWPDTIVQEANLSQQVFVLRKVLGERPNDRRYILTVPGRGYRFVSDVRDERPAPVSDRVSGLAPARGEIESIAVLPFRTLDGELDHEHVGLGLADAIITRLSGLLRPIVRPTSAVLRHADPTLDPCVVGRLLNVDALLLGTLRRSGDRIRVTVQLVAVSNAATLWAARFDEHLTDLFALEDSISDQVKDALLVELTDDEHTRLTKRYTRSTDAQQAYFKGRYFWNKRTEVSLRRAVECFEQAIAQDPGYALAYAGIADCRNMLSIYSAVPPSEGCLRAAEAAARAIAIDPTLAEAHTSLAYANFNYHWDVEGAERDFVRAFQLKPNYAIAYQLYADLLTAAGRFGEAITAITRAQALDPVSLVINTDIGVILFHAREHDRAIQQLRETLELDGSLWYTHWVLGLNYEQQGRHRDAIDTFLQARTLVPHSPYVVASLGRAYWAAGQRQLARQALDEVMRLAATRYVSPYVIALIHAAFENADQTLAWLDRAYDERAHWLAFIDVDPMLDPLRTDPRFQALSRRVNARRHTPVLRAARAPRPGLPDPAR